LRRSQLAPHQHSLTAALQLQGWRRCGQTHSSSSSSSSSSSHLHSLTACLLRSFRSISAASAPSELEQLHGQLIALEQTASFLVEGLQHKRADSLPSTAEQDAAAAQQKLQHMGSLLKAIRWEMVQLRKSLSETSASMLTGVVC
jgi:hypothetical protein